MTDADLHNIERLLACGWDECVDIPELVAEVRRLRAESTRLRTQAHAGYALSTWAAAIRLDRFGGNTQEWLNGLRERIEQVQELAKAGEGECQ